MNVILREVAVAHGRARRLTPLPSSGHGDPQRNRRGANAALRMTWVALFRLCCLAIIGGLASAQVALAAGPILQVTQDGTSSVRPAWSPDGSKLAFQTSQDNTYRVFVMNADGSDRKQITQGPSDDRHPAWSP